MTNQHIAATGISQLTGGNLASQRTLHRLDRTVLRTNRNILACQPGNRLTDVEARRHYRHIHTTRQG
ncbi:hypothetical protein D3C86_1854550 [compost metagenome]